MQAGFFEKQIVLTPDLCGSAAALSPLAAFTIFQGIASEHAERIGVGGAAMAKRGEFWLTVHSRVDFYEPAYLMDALTAQGMEMSGKLGRELDAFLASKGISFDELNDAGIGTLESMTLASA